MAKETSPATPLRKSALRRLLSGAILFLRLLRALFLAYAVAFSLIGSIALGLAGWKAWKLYDSVAGLRTRWPEKTALMRMREAQWADSGIHVETRWTPVPLSRISENLQRTVLVGEDDKFYQHHGFDFDAIQSALAEDEHDGKMKRGASTITQQLAKNLYLSPRKSLARKAVEALYTVALEHFLGKQRILELYLNVIEWGRGVYGAEAASETYYGIHASELTLDQAASLAAVLPKPLKVRPNGNNRYVAFRKAAILQNLRQFKGIGDTAEADQDDDDGEDSGQSEPEKVPTDSVRHSVEATPVGDSTKVARLPAVVDTARER
jgi:monofunctional biosynthetic peptidoglycan transglycosylase